MKTSHNTHRYKYTDDNIYGSFNFDMHLNAGDYLYLALYFTFVLPIILLSKAATSCFSLIKGKTPQGKNNSTERIMSHRIHALISKFF